jgi:hypothetical protein
MFNVAIVANKLKITAIIANILDTSILKELVISSSFRTKLIPSAIPRIPPIRLPKEKNLTNIEAVFLKFSVITSIGNIITADSDDKIQDNVRNTRAAISISYLLDDVMIGKSIHIETLPFHSQRRHNPSVFEIVSQVFFPLKEK